MLAVTAPAADTYRMEQTMRTSLALVSLILLTSSALAQQPLDIQTITIGPWGITTTYKADKFDNCTMTRSTADLGISFVRNQDGLLLLLESPKWKLERGKVYSVRLAAGSQSVEAKALAESKGVTIALADRPFNEKLFLKCEEKALRFVCRWSKVRQRLNVLTSASRKTVAREQRVIPSSHPVGRRSGVLSSASPTCRAPRTRPTAAPRPL
jgi:hypothetical protein